MRHPQPSGQPLTFTPEQRRILPVLLIPAFVSLLAVSSVNVILPAIAASVPTSTGGLQLVVSGYSLVFGVLLVPAGRAGDVVGRGRLFVAGLVLFGLGSLAAGVAPSILALNLARVLMGVGSGLFNPQVTGLIQQYYAGAARGRAFGLFGGVIGVSVAVGPLMSGALIGALGDQWGWRSSFLIFVPFALAGAWVAWRALPPTAWGRPDAVPGAGAGAGTGPGRGLGPDAVPGAGAGARGAAAAGEAAGRAGGSGPAPRGPAAPSGRGTRRPVDLDPVGMTLLTVATGLVMVPFMEYQRGAWVWGLLVAGLVLVAGWVAWERRYAARGRAPMVDLSLFRVPSFAYGSLAIAVYFMGDTSIWIITAQYLQAGLGYSALASGLMGLPASVASAVGASVSGRSVTRVGRVMVLRGMVLGLVGLGATVVVVHLNAVIALSPWWMAVTLLLLGAGQGLVVSPNQTLSLADVPLPYAGAAGGIIQTGERIGTAIGISAITGLAFSVARGSGWHTASQVGLGAIAAVIAVSALVAWADLRASARRDRRPPSLGQAGGVPDGPGTAV